MSVRKVFPGSNSAYGFYSFYDYIIPDDANRVFVIKGGPGVGKSTFMRQIGEKLIAMGFDTEFHCCSADNESIDGLVIPALGAACIDGTSPHVVDPKHPGAVDEIIHLGDYWNETEMRKNRREIISINNEISRLFRRAYSYLSAAKLFIDEVEGYYRENNALDMKGINQITLKLIEEIFSQEPVNEIAKMWQGKGERHLFATAITPEGAVCHLETVTNTVKQKYIIAGDDGTGKNELVSRITDAARMRGFFTEVFHCALDPHKIDHLLIPALDTAILNSVTPHILKSEERDRVIDLDMFTGDPGKEFVQERNTARRLHREAFDTAVYFIRRAKKAHDELEMYYIPNMSFQEIESHRDVVMEKIIGMAGSFHAYFP